MPKKTCPQSMPRCLRLRTSHVHASLQRRLQNELYRCALSVYTLAGTRSGAVIMQVWFPACTYTTLFVKILHVHAHPVLTPYNRKERWRGKPPKAKSRIKLKATTPHVANARQFCVSTRKYIAMSAAPMSSGASAAVSCTSQQLHQSISTISRKLSQIPLDCREHKTFESPSFPGTLQRLPTSR